MANPVIIICAVTGGIHTPTMSSYLPITRREIASAAIIHLHARRRLALKGAENVNF